MNKSKLLILLFLVLVFRQANSQVCIAYIEVDSAFLLETKEYYLEINGVDVSKPNHTVVVPVHEVGFDTIKFRCYGREHMYQAFAKLKNGVRYQLNSNSCSFYTFQPIKNPLQGMIHFASESQDTITYVGVVDQLDFIKFNNDLDEGFYFTPPSAMCLFASRPIEITTIDEEPLQQMRFHFLHGELIEVKYVGTDNLIELSLKGYVKNTSDYRYNYSH